MTTNSSIGIGSSSITTLGTISTGVWNGTQVGVQYGGTGDASFTAYSVLCGGTTSTGALQNVSGVGSSTQVLTSNGPGALPTWQTPSSGSFKLITSVTASNQATIAFNSQFSASYNVYLFTFTNIQPVNATDTLYGQVGTGAGPTWTTTGYNWQNVIYKNSGEIGEGNTSDAQFKLTSGTAGDLITNTSAGYNGFMYLYGANGVSNYAYAHGLGTYISTGTAFSCLCDFSFENASAIYTSIKFFFTGGNVNTGTIRMYGLTP